MDSFKNSLKGHVPIADLHIISCGSWTVWHVCCCVPQTLFAASDLQMMFGHLPTWQLSVPLFSHCASNLSVQWILMNVCQNKLTHRPSPRQQRVSELGAETASCLALPLPLLTPRSLPVFVSLLWVTDLQPQTKQLGGQSGRLHVRQTDYHSGMLWVNQPFIHNAVRKLQHFCLSFVGTSRGISLTCQQQWTLNRTEQPRKHFFF